MVRTIVMGVIFSLWLIPQHGFAAKEKKDWQFSLAPFYLWGINIEGDLAAGPVNGQIDIPFEDVFGSMEAMFVVHFEGVYDKKFGVIVDIDYLDLENSGALPNGTRPEIGLELTLAEVSGFYRLNRDGFVVDLIAGLRYLDMDNSIELQGVPIQLDGRQDWLDPLVGARWIWHAAERWSLILRGDLGGFGVGSDLAYHALGAVEWQPWKYAAFIAGYRILDVDYETGSGPEYFSFDARIHGPIFGLNFKW